LSLCHLRDVEPIIEARHLREVGQHPIRKVSKINLRFHVAFRLPHIVIGLDRTQQQVAGTSTAETPANLRTDITSAAPFTSYSAYTADGNATPVVTELARKQGACDFQGTPATAEIREFNLLYEPVNPPFIVGPSNISVWFGGDIATPGFIQASVLMIPAALITGLS